MKSLSTKKIIHSLSLKYNISESIITELLEFPFRFLTKEIESLEFNNVRLLHLGKFAVSDKRFNNYAIHYITKNDGKYKRKKAKYLE